ncbi:MAG: DNA glycosylase AlkZ-like family protein, partial [Candidatus Hermodarchaeia archaeon]
MTSSSAYFKGLVTLTSGEHWNGIRGVKAPQRRAIVKRLAEQGKVIPVSAEGLEGQTFFMRESDLVTLNSIKGKRAPKAQAALIAPLDNLMWNRKLVQSLFGFSYVWEVYKPKAQREFGYYVLPVLYGDRFIA